MEAVLGYCQMVGFISFVWCYVLTGITYIYGPINISISVIFYPFWHSVFNHCNNLERWFFYKNVENPSSSVWLALVTNKLSVRIFWHHHNIIQNNLLFAIQCFGEIKRVPYGLLNYYDCFNKNEWGNFSTKHWHQWMLIKCKWHSEASAT